MESLDFTHPISPLQSPDSLAIQHAVRPQSCRINRRFAKKTVPDPLVGMRRQGDGCAEFQSVLVKTKGTFASSLPAHGKLGPPSKMKEGR